MARVDFTAHETKRVPTAVKFTKKDGEVVKFKAEVPKRVTKHVQFKTHTKRG